ncbi:hypothetical protein SLS55_003072 [Diplodia seriata]|uniref:RRM domain-containing protein n=1 Tax=Diplodia seriata TaxID=420778 RepID=A0ABR3CLZ4_9PEZI
MAQVTPPPSSPREHRRARSTPQRVSSDSSGDETSFMSPGAPSIPSSPVESRGGVTVPSTPLSPPLDGDADHDERCRDGSIGEMKGSSKPASVADLYDAKIFLTDSDETPAPCPTVVKPDRKALFEGSALSRRRQALQRPHLIPSRSDPVGLYAMVENQLPQPREDPFMPVHPEETVSSTSSRPGSSSREEESAAFEAYVRAGRSEKIDAGNAQAKLTPEACLFVASLRKDKPDREIHAALVEEFRRYGTCYIKVKRNGEIPIAFVQYHGKNNANIAMECATGASILERPCRIEKARAPRSVFVSRRDGRTPSRAEVLQLLQKVGEVDKVWAISELERERFALPPGFGCRFAFYQDSVDAITYYRDHRVYDVENFRAPERNPLPTFARDSILSEPNRTANIPRFDANVHMRNALWVGGLPSSVSKSEVLRIFSNPRRVISHVDIRIRTVAPGTGEASYAVINFADDQSAFDAALCTYRRLRLSNGERVRIQWAFKDLARNFGRGPISGFRDYDDCAFGTYLGTCSYPRPSGGMAPPGPHGPHGPYGLHGPHGAFVNGTSQFPVGHIAGQQSAQHVAQHAVVNSQIYGMYPNGGHVANRAIPSTGFVGYPVVNGTYPVCSRFPTRL